MITLREYDAARNVATYTVDTEAEIAQLPNLVTGDDKNGLGPVAMGSSVICLENMTLYMLDGNNEYVAFGSGNGGGGGGGSTEIKIPRFSKSKFFDDVKNATYKALYDFERVEDGHEYACSFTAPNDEKQYYAVLYTIEHIDGYGYIYGTPRVYGQYNVLETRDNLYGFEDEIYDLAITDIFSDGVFESGSSLCYYKEVGLIPIHLKSGVLYEYYYDFYDFDTGDAELDEQLTEDRENILNNLKVVIVEAEYDTYTVSGGGGSGTPNAVQYVPQTLTDAQKLQARTNIGAPSSVDELSDVDISSIANNDVLKYNESTEKWENGQVTNPITVGSAPLTPGISTLDPGTIYIWYEDTV